MDLVALIGAIPGLAAYVPVLTGLIAACAAFAAAVPAPSGPAWWTKVYAVINFVGLNFGHAKNAGAKE